MRKVVDTFLGMPIDFFSLNDYQISSIKLWIGEADPKELEALFLDEQNPDHNRAYDLLAYLYKQKQTGTLRTVTKKIASLGLLSLATFRHKTLELGINIRYQYPSTLEWNILTDAITRRKSFDQYILYIKGQITKANLTLLKYLVVIIKGDLHQCSYMEATLREKNRAVLNSLLALIYLNMNDRQNRPKYHLENKLNNSKKDYVQQAMQLFNNINPSDLNHFDDQDLACIAESIIYFGGIALKTQKDIVNVSNESLSYLIVDEKLNCYEAISKGLEYLIKAILKTSCSDYKILNHEEIQFLSVLDMDDHDNENRIALKSWINHLAENNHESSEGDEKNLIKKKLTELKEQEEKVRNKGWDSNIYQLLSHIVKQRIEGQDEDSEKFYRQLSGLKIKFEIATGREDNISLQRLIQQTRELITAEVRRIQTSSLLYSATYEKTLSSFFEMPCLESKSAGEVTYQEEKDTKPNSEKVRLKNEVDTWTDIVKSLNPSILTAIFSNINLEFYRVIPFCEIMTTHNYYIIIPLLKLIPEEALTIMLQIKDQNQKTLLHNLKSHDVEEYLINNLHSHHFEKIFLSEEDKNFWVLKFSNSSLNVVFIKKLIQENKLIEVLQKENADGTKLFEEIFRKIDKVSPDFVNSLLDPGLEKFLELCSLKGKNGISLVVKIFDLKARWPESRPICYEHYEEKSFINYIDFEKLCSQARPYLLHEIILHSRVDTCHLLLQHLHNKNLPDNFHKVFNKDEWKSHHGASPLNNYPSHDYTLIDLIFARKNFSNEEPLKGIPITAIAFAIKHTVNRDPNYPKNDGWIPHALTVCNKYICNVIIENLNIQAVVINSEALYNFLSRRDFFQDFEEEFEYDEYDDGHIDNKSSVTFPSLKETLSDYKLLLHPEQSLKKNNPSGLIEILRKRINADIEQYEVEFLIIKIEQALKVFPETKKAHFHALQGLLLKLFRLMAKTGHESTAEKKEIEVRDTKEEGSEIPEIKIEPKSAGFTNYYSEKYHRLSLEIKEPLLAKLGSEIYLSIAMDLFAIIAIPYLEASRGVKLSKMTPRFLNIIAGPLNIHEIYFQILNYISAVWRTTGVNSLKHTEANTLFCMVLAVIDGKLGPMHKGELMEWWFHYMKEPLTKKPRPLIEKRLTEILSASKRLNNPDWLRFSQGLMKQHLRRLDLFSQEFINELLQLKFKFEMAVSLKNHERLNETGILILKELKAEQMRAQDLPYYYSEWLKKLEHDFSSFFKAMPGNSWEQVSCSQISIFPPPPPPTESKRITRREKREISQEVKLTRDVDIKKIQKRTSATEQLSLNTRANQLLLNLGKEIIELYNQLNRFTLLFSPSSLAILKHKLADLVKLFGGLENLIDHPASPESKGQLIHCLDELNKSHTIDKFCNFVNVDKPGFFESHQTKARQLVDEIQKNIFAL